MHDRFGIDESALDAYCRRWKIREMSLFGPVLREDFGPDSDIDVLVSFEDEANWSLLDHFDMREELSALLGRSVDLLTRRSVERSHNWLRRKNILGSAESVYVKG